MSSEIKLHLKFQCLDRFNENHELSKTVLTSDKTYVNLIENLSAFQTEVNTLMTGLVDKEKAEIKEKPKVNSKCDSEEGGEEVSDEDDQVNEEIETKKQKVN